VSDREERIISATPPLRIAMALYGDLTFDSRVQREARSLAEAGYRVVVACLDASESTLGDLAPVEVVVVRPRRTDALPTGEGPFLRPAATEPSRAGRVLAIPRTLLDRVRWLVDYRATLLEWGRLAVDAVGPVDRWHAHDLTGLLAIDAAIDRSLGRVYDAHEIFVETGSAARLPWMARRLIARFEGRLARRAGATIAVNPGIAALLTRWGRLTNVVVVRNCLPRQDPSLRQRDALRSGLGLPAETRIVLFHGNLAVDRGIERVVDLLGTGSLGEAHVVCLGNGELTPWLRERAADPSVDGRLHVLSAVPPAELPALVASADVGVVLQQPTDLNLRLSTPNKLWECLAVGTPVVASDFPEIRRVVVGDPDGPLGLVCDPTDGDAIATAVRSLAEADEAARRDLRARCLRAAAERWNWETEAGRLVELHRSLDPH
jgi:glycosyltransferase involved in cell wall biosynthesis